MVQVDLLITNANVLTLDEKSRIGGSVAVSNGNIIGIWTEAKPPRASIEYNSRTQVIDLKGATLLPGFIDTHNHLLMYSQFRKQANCSSPLNPTIEDIQARLLSMAKQTEKENWILGFGYDDTLLKEKRHPTRAELDAVVPDHPVFIRHVSAHFGVVNSAALKMAGMDETVLDPPGGHLGRDGSGQLNGILYELPAMNMVEKKIPAPSLDLLVSLLSEGSKDYLETGITTNTDAGVGLNMGIVELEAHLKAIAERKNPLRMRLMVMHNLLREGNELGKYTANELNLEIIEKSCGRARLDSAKLFQDGSIQGLTAALRQPYHCNPGVSGDLLHEQNEFNEEILDLNKRGFRITTHGNGDRAIGSILDAYEFALKKNPRIDHRHRIEHLQTVTKSDLERMKKLGVAGSFFINHVYYWGDRHKKLFLGPERANSINPLRDALLNNLLFTVHSDCPVTPISPLFSVWAAVNRITMGGEVLGHEQRIDVESALRSMTIWGAELNFDEKNTGSIEIGKRADFVILSEDPLKVDPLEIKDIPVLATIVNGQVLYQKDWSLIY
ncbi:amidohydrolase [Peribacillus frigoritolerans]|uniref:amidohydrolase n=1 Tax=Peribacillus frigoritolerans TaxID=450367 RepID=UPI003D034D8E